MADNAIEAKGGVITGTDPEFVVEFRPAGIIGCALMVKFDKGTADGVALTIDSINQSMGTTDKYAHIIMSGDSVEKQTFSISESGNYRIPLQLLAGETRLYVNVTFSAEGKDATLAIEMLQA